MDVALRVGSTPPPIRNARFHVVFPRSVNATWKHGFVWALRSIWESGWYTKHIPFLFSASRQSSFSRFCNQRTCLVLCLCLFVCYASLLEYEWRRLFFFLWSIQWMELDWIPFRIHVCFGVNTRFYNCSYVENVIITEEPLNIQDYGSHYMNWDVLPLF